MSSFSATANKSITRYRKQKINWQELKQVIVFIDAANIIYSLRSLGWRMDYKKLYQFFVANSRCQDIYFYTSMRPNNQKDKKWLNLLRRIGYKTRVRQLKFIRKYDGSIEPKGNKEFAEYKKTNSDTKSERLEFSSRPKPGETSNPE